MKKVFFYLIALFITINKSFSQNKSIKKENKPKLVVGIVLDQMRWDYLFRFDNLFSKNGGFKRLLNDGFSCNNTYVPYTPTVTACGHTCIYTGSVPNIHGIVGNDWYDNQLQKKIYCTQDESVEGLGENAQNKIGRQSTKNLLVTTITDELRLATNFKSKVIGISAKDRGAILPAGHNANGAYWYNKETGNFISSNHYFKSLPSWITKFNARKLADSFLNLGWQLSLPKSIYEMYCDMDSVPYESTPFGIEQKRFPYKTSQFIDKKDYGKLINTPYGSSIVAELAKAAILNENLGKNLTTDFLAISFSSTDYIGHSYGPNSWELLDCYIKIDKELANIFNLLDNQIGKNNYTVFLTADHAVAHIPAFLQKNKIPAGTFDDGAFMKQINKNLQTITGLEKTIISIDNYQITLDVEKLEKNKVEIREINKIIIDSLLKIDAIELAFELKEIMLQPIQEKVKQMLVNGYYPKRCGQIQFILKPGYIDGSKQGTTHGLWNPYDSHIPLLWYGFGIKKGSTNKENFMTDIAPTLAALLKIQVPNGCVGKVIEEVLK